MAAVRSSNRDMFEAIPQLLLPEPPPEFSPEQNVRGNFIKFNQRWFRSSDTKGSQWPLTLDVW